MESKVINWLRELRKADYVFLSPTDKKIVEDVYKQQLVSIKNPEITSNSYSQDSMQSILNSFENKEKILLKEKLEKKIEGNIKEKYINLMKSIEYYLWNDDFELKEYEGVLARCTTSVEKDSENILTEEALEKTIREMTYGK